MKKLLVFITILGITALACNMPGVQLGAQQGPQAISQLLVTPDPNATATPTPFLPVLSTPGEGTSLPTGEPTLEPSVTVTIQPTLVTSKDVVKILLLGSDWRPNSGFRTDVMMLVAINKKTGAASLVSFPRDLFVTLPGVKQERINTAMAFGGFELTQQTFQYNFGFTPDYYVMTNFQGFVNIIDTLGGITVYAGSQLTDTCSLPIADDEGNCTLGPGQISMDGATALWYVRSRYSTSDFDRTRRAQEVIKATFFRLMNLNAIGRVPELFNSLKNNVETNLPLDVAVSLARFAPDLLANTDKIHQYAIGPREVWAWKTPEGAQVLLPNPDLIQPLLYEALNVK
ncbi:MAG TPA: LCP family protein [Bellilinea sp.]|nr:LCP family protein [Bellilinea sp.]